MFRPLPTHPKYLGSIRNPEGMFDHDVYYTIKGKRPTYADLLRDIKDGRVTGEKAEYVRDVARWCKKNPGLWQEWHHKFMAAVEEMK